MENERSAACPLVGHEGRDCLFPGFVALWSIFKRQHFVFGLIVLRTTLIHFSGLRKPSPTELPSGIHLYSLSRLLQTYFSNQVSLTDGLVVNLIIEK